MSIGIVDRLTGTPALPVAKAMAPFLVLAGMLLTYVLLRLLLLTVATGPAWACLVLTLGTCVLAGGLSFVRYAEISAPLRVLGLGIGVVVLVQLAFDASTLFYAPASLQGGAAGQFFHAGMALGMLAGCAALWRPSFLLPLFFYYVMFRHQFNIATGVSVSDTDYLSMLDVGEFVAIGGLGTALLIRSGLLVRFDADGRLKIATSSLIWACAVGAHLSNYFVSGWTKIRAGGDDPLFWLLHNPTQTSILIGLERGDGPLALWPWLVQPVWDGIVAGGVLLNLFVLGTQLAAPLAIAHRRLLMTVTVLFDLFHIGVYLTLGALFHFWIAVNVLIFMSARRMDDKALTWPMKLVTLAAVLTGHFIFYTSHLGWLDGAKLASPSFLAETADGRKVPVPPVFFGMHSYSIGQTLMYTPDGHFPVRIGGNSYNKRDWLDAQTCGAQVGAEQTSAVGWPTLERMVQEADAAVRARPVVKDLNLYYLYPHHMMANPWLFGDFNRLSMDQIVRYHYVVESVCLGLKDGQLTRDVRHRTDDVIHVQR